MYVHNDDSNFIIIIIYCRMRSNCDLAYFNNGAGIVAVLVLLLLLVVGVVVSLKASNEGIAQLVGHVGGQSEEQSGLFFV